MANTNGESHQEIGYYAVCLIDILGQADRLQGWARLPENGVADAAFVNALKDTIGAVQGFSRGFHRFFEEVQQTTMPDKLAELNQTQQEDYWRSKACDLRTQQFSDTFVFYTLLRNAAGDVPVSGMYRLIGACCMGMMMSFAAGKPIRGALCIGAGTELCPGNFYGPVLAEAHHCESKVADYPRVLVSDTVRDLLAKGQRYSSNDMVNKIMQEVAGISRSMLSQDADRRWIVDFLGEGFLSIVTDCTHAKRAVTEGYAFVRREFGRFRDSGNGKLTEKYRQLLNYFESRIGLWGIQREAV